MAFKNDPNLFLHWLKEELMYSTHPTYTLSACAASYLYELAGRNAYGTAFCSEDDEAQFHMPIEELNSLLYMALQRTPKRTRPAFRLVAA